MLTIVSENIQKGTSMISTNSIETISPYHESPIPQLFEYGIQTESSESVFQLSIWFK